MESNLVNILNVAPSTQFIVSMYETANKLPTATSKSSEMKFLQDATKSLRNKIHSFFISGEYFMKSDANTTPAEHLTERNLSLYQAWVEDFLSEKKVEGSVKIKNNLVVIEIGKFIFDFDPRSADFQTVANSLRDGILRFRKDKLN